MVDRRGQAEPNAKQSPLRCADLLQQTSSSADDLAQNRAGARRDVDIDRCLAKNARREIGRGYTDDAFADVGGKYEAKIRVQLQDARRTPAAGLGGLAFLDEAGVKEIAKPLHHGDAR